MSVTVSPSSNVLEEIKRQLLRIKAQVEPRVLLSPNLRVDEWLVMKGTNFRDGIPRIVMNPSWHRRVKRETDLYFELSPPALHPPRYEPYME